jgi:hypothetical protein
MRAAVILALQPTSEAGVQVPQPSDGFGIQRAKELLSHRAVVAFLLPSALRAAYGGMHDHDAQNVQDPLRLTGDERGTIVDVEL